MPSQSVEKSWLFEGMTHKTYVKYLSDERQCSLGSPNSISFYNDFEGYWSVEFHSGKHIGQLLLALLMGMAACT